MKKLIPMFLVLASAGAGSAPVVAAEVATTLPPMVVTAEAAREIIGRTIREGFSNTRSNRSEDADKWVCILQNKTASHLKQLACATNRAWNEDRNLNFILNSGSIATIALNATSFSSGGFKSASQGRTQFNSFSKGGPAGLIDNKFLMIENVTRSKLDALVADYGDGSLEDNRAELIEELRKAMLRPLDNLHGVDFEEYLAFLKSYERIKELEGSVTSESRAETLMASAISENGLDVDRYNAIYDLVVSDELIKARMLNALNIPI